MTNKIFFLKEDEEYVQNIKNFFPNIQFEVIESDKKVFDEKKIC